MTISSLINECVVFIGAGQAAIQAADTLRTEGFEGRIVIIGVKLVRLTNARSCLKIS